MKQSFAGRLHSCTPIRYPECLLLSHRRGQSPKQRFPLSLWLIRASWWKSGEHVSLRWAHSWEVTEKGEVLCCSANSAFMCTFRSWPSIVKSGLMRRDYFSALPENVYMLNWSTMLSTRPCQTQRHNHSLTCQLFSHYMMSFMSSVHQDVQSSGVLSEMHCRVLCCLCRSSVERSCWTSVPLSNEDDTMRHLRQSPPLW